MLHLLVRWHLVRLWIKSWSSAPSLSVEQPSQEVGVTAAVTAQEL